MTVKELIEVLKKYEQDDEVCIWSITQNKFVLLSEDDIQKYAGYKTLFIDKN